VGGVEEAGAGSGVGAFGDQFEGDWGQIKIVNERGFTAETQRRREKKEGKEGGCAGWGGRIFPGLGRRGGGGRRGGTGAFASGWGFSCLLFFSASLCLCGNSPSSPLFSVGFSRAWRAPTVGCRLAFPGFATPLDRDKVTPFNQGRLQSALELPWRSLFASSRGGSGQENREYHRVRGSTDWISS
jgi:hypothetical protein